MNGVYFFLKFMFISQYIRNSFLTSNWTKISSLIVILQFLTIILNLGTHQRWKKSRMHHFEWVKFLIGVRVLFFYLTNIQKLSVFTFWGGRGFWCKIKSDPKTKIEKNSLYHFPHDINTTPLSDAYNPPPPSSPPWGHELEVMVTIFTVSDSWRLFTQNIFGGKISEKAVPWGPIS